MYSSDKLHFNLMAKKKLELHFEVKSAYFVFTFMSSGHSKNNHKTLLESVVASFSKGGNGINSKIIGMESLWETYFWNTSKHWIGGPKRFQRSQNEGSEPVLSEDQSQP